MIFLIFICLRLLATIEAPLPLPQLIQFHFSAHPINFHCDHFSLPLELKPHQLQYNVVLQASLIEISGGTWSNFQHLYIKSDTWRYQLLFCYDPDHPRFFFSYLVMCWSRLTNFSNYSFPLSPFVFLFGVGLPWDFFSIPPHDIVYPHNHRSRVSSHHQSCEQVSHQCALRHRNMDSIFSFENRNEMVFLCGVSGMHKSLNGLALIVSN